MKIEKKRGGGQKGCDAVTKILNSILLLVFDYLKSFEKNKFYNNFKNYKLEEANKP